MKIEKIISELDGFTTEIIDFELCGYKKIDNYQIEISFLNKALTKYNVYVWKVDKHLKLVEKKINIKTFEALKCVLANLEEELNG